MGVFNNQSQIGEVRDELSLDYADDGYLNIIAANLGLQRPPFGFTDATWRALVKTIALRYKQIRDQFEAVLTIILGPKVTQVGAFAQNVVAGDKHAVLVNSSQFPQVGTMVIDEGLANQETADYIFIDRYTNTVYFKNPLVFSHTALNQEWESGVIAPVNTGEKQLVVFDPSGFITPSPSYPVVIGRGTPYEYVDLLTAVSALPSRSLTLVTGSPAGSPGVQTPTGLTTTLTAFASQMNAYYLSMLDVAQLPLEKGYLQGKISATYTTTAGTTTSVTVSSTLSSLAPYTGYFIVFDGNVTASLAGKVAYVKTNTTNTFTFFNTLSAPPVAGDTFKLLDNFQYIRSNTADNSVLMKFELPDLNTFAASTQFTLTEPTVTVAIAQIQVKHVDWDVFQSDPRNVEILLPKDFLVNDLRTASYIHSIGDTGSATTNATRTLGDTNISVTSTAAMPVIGVLKHSPTGDCYAYYNAHAYLSTDVLAGATTLKVNDTSLFDSSGTLRVTGGTVAYTVVDLTTLSVGAIPSAMARGTLVRDEHIFKLPRALQTMIGSGDALVYYPATTTPPDTGDIWHVLHTWAGPYVWDMFAETIKKETSPGTVIDNTPPNIQMLAGPVRSEVDRLAGSTVFEIEDLSAFPQNFPYEVKLGENSGNVELLSVQGISLKERTYTTLAANANPGDTTIQVASLTGPTGPLHAFPNGFPYRVYIVNTPEVLEVIGTLTGPNRLVINPATPVSVSHLSGDRVVLLSDLMLVSPASADDHLGSIKATDKFKNYAPLAQYDQADVVRPVYDNIPLTTAVDFSSTAANAVVNFGNRLNLARQRLSSAYASGTTLQFASTTMFPTTNFPYVLYVDVGAGPLFEEKCYITANNTGTGQLTTSHALRFTHNANVLCEFRPGPVEVFSYTSKTGNVINSTGLELEFTHQRPEFIAPTVGTNYPRSNGFDFPLRIPVSLEDRIRFIVDLIRAAGVQVTFISKR